MGIRIKSKAVQHGFHFDQSGFRDNMQVRCSRCGFICNMDRDLKSRPTGREGWGTRFIQYYNVTTLTPRIVVKTVQISDYNPNNQLTDYGLNVQAVNVYQTIQLVLEPTGIVVPQTQTTISTLSTEGE